MKRITFALFLALNACGTEQQPATRIEYVQEPASDTQAAAVQSAIDANTAAPAAASGPSAVATPTPTETAAPLPPPTLEANSTPQDANSAVQQVLPVPSPTPSPTPTPTATPACSQTNSDGTMNYACGTWTIAGADQVQFQPACPGANHAALWSLANQPDDTVGPDGYAYIHGVGAFNPTGIATSAVDVFVNGRSGAQEVITCYLKAYPAGND